MVLYTFHIEENQDREKLNDLATAMWDMHDQAATTIQILN